jgi:ATP-dependent Clp protease ATP-binding subunit ClpA
MSIASDVSRASASASRPRFNSFILVQPDATFATANSTECRVGEAVQQICQAAADLAHTLQSPEMTAAHLILAILANDAARAELKAMGVRNEFARMACLAQVGALGAAGSGAGGLQPAAEDAMRALLRRAMKRALDRHDPELHVVGVGDLCAALMDLSRHELRIRMLLQGSRPLSTTEVAVRDAERNILRHLAALEQRTADKKHGNALIKLAVGIALLAVAVLASWYAVGSGGGWSTALRWLGQMLA